MSTAGLLHTHICTDFTLKLFDDTDAHINDIQLLKIVSNTSLCAVRNFILAKPLTERTTSSEGYVNFRIVRRFGKQELRFRN